MALDWYRICWPWMTLYSSIIPCVALFTLPVGAFFVLKGLSTLPDFILVICMSFSVGMPLLKAMSFAGRIPQLGYKIDALEKLMEHPPLQQSSRDFEGKDIVTAAIRHNYLFAKKPPAVPRSSPP